MTISGTVIWIAVIGLAIWAAGASAEAHNQRRSNFLIIGCGAIFPTIALAALLVYGLAPLPTLLAPAPEGSLKIAVAGEQWWWRVRYQVSADEPVILANEIR
ncbi:MAG TPA: cytochrome B, partial [Candidatus Binatia bacterium]|nr:cytochrome B [Candidatus Binatia bacterium]